MDDAVDVIPGEHLPGEGKLYSEKSFRLKLYAFTPKLHLMLKVSKLTVELFDNVYIIPLDTWSRGR